MKCITIGSGGAQSEDASDAPSTGRIAKIKAVHLTSVHAPSDTRIAYRECASLAEAGYDVVLVAAGPLRSEPPAGVRLRSIPLPRNRFERITRTVWQTFAAALDERATIYHFHDPELLGVGIALRLLGRRVIFDVHEDIPKDVIDKPWIASFLRRPLSLICEIVLRAAQRHMSAIVAATPAIARRFQPPRVVVVANYPRLEELPAPNGEAFEQRPRVALYLGSITELRCIEELVAGMSSRALAPNVRLCLAGTFESPALEAQMRKRPGWQRIDFAGFCPRSRVGDLLRSARVGMLLFRPAANHDDALPTKLFEYLGSGLPVVISDSLRCSDLVREYQCGVVVNAREPDAIARAISYIIDHPCEAQRMGERGRRIVEERYQWTSEAEKLKKLYAEIA